MRARLCLVVVFCLLAGISALAQIFVAPPEYPAADDPVAIAVGDFNGDGKPDLAVTNTCPVGGCGTTSVVSILLGNGDGTFQPHVDYPAGNGPGSIAVGDFNGDGKQDLAIAGTSTLSVLFGNGDGTFQPLVPYTTLGGNNSVAVGDFNGDGALDLAVVNEASNSVSVFINSGTGTFQPGKTLLRPTSLILWPWVISTVMASWISPSRIIAAAFWAAMAPPPAASRFFWAMAMEPSSLIRTSR